MTGNNQVKHTFYKDLQRSDVCEGILKTWGSFSFPRYDEIEIERLFWSFHAVHLFKCFYKNFLCCNLFL